MSSRGGSSPLSHGTLPARRINEIVHGQRRISAGTALRPARFFGTSERFWINLRARFDLEAEKDRLGDALEGIRPLSAASQGSARGRVRGLVAARLTG